MLKFRTTLGADGTSLVGLGLSEENIQRLKEGQPILIHGEEIGLPEIKIAIMYGKTEQTLYEDLKKSGVTINHSVFSMKAFRKDN